MAIEGLRKYSTTLFTGVLSGQQTYWSGLLPNHTNLTNHQLVMTADTVIDDGTGLYDVYVIPDADGVTQAVFTGLTLNLSNKDSAIVNFTGVIRGLYLVATAPIIQASVHISAVLSSFSRYKKTSVQDNEQSRLDYVSSEFRTFKTGVTDYATSAPNHTNLVYHQILLMSDDPIDDVYRVRLIPESESALETSVDLDVELDFGGTQSAMGYFGGVLTGVVLQRQDGTSANVDVRVVMSSTVERNDEVVYRYIGESPSLGDHETDYDNPHQVTYEQLGGEKPIIGFPIVSEVVPGSEQWVIPVSHQLLVWETYSVVGTLEVRPEGNLIVLHDRPESRAAEPDFTYNLNGNLTQIDYAAGEQKLFTYNGSEQLTQVDILRDGTTLRKSFVYTGGGELDYITETWL